MMSSRIQAKQLTIKRVRDPGKRMPVARVGGEKCPFDPSGSETCFYYWIINDVLRIIIIDELKTCYLPEDANGNRRQQETDKLSAANLRHEQILTKGNEDNKGEEDS